jgi:hypothetical protein
MNFKNRGRIEIFLNPLSNVFTKAYFNHILYITSGPIFSGESVPYSGKSATQSHMPVQNYALFSFHDIIPLKENSSGVKHFLRYSFSEISYQIHGFPYCTVKRAILHSEHCESQRM